MKDEALKLALEALELHLAHHEHGCVYLDPALAAIKEALAQPEQEQSGFFSREAMKAHSDWHVAQPEQEPVAIVHVRPLIRHESIPQTRIEWKNGRPVAGPLYTTPPKRQPLTDEEIGNIYRAECIDLSCATKADFFDIARAIEAAHGIKE